MLGLRAGRISGHARGDAVPGNSTAPIPEAAEVALLPPRHSSRFLESTGPCPPPVALGERTRALERPHDGSVELRLSHLPPGNQLDR